MSQFYHREPGKGSMIALLNPFRGSSFAEHFIPNCIRGYSQLTTSWFFQQILNTNHNINRFNADFILAGMNNKIGQVNHSGLSELKSVFNTLFSAKIRVLFLRFSNLMVRQFVVFITYLKIIKKNQIKANIVPLILSNFASSFKTHI